MTFIPFKSQDNRLYIDHAIYLENAQLRDFIHTVNMETPGTFVVDPFGERVYYYPPENTIMAPIKEKPHATSR